MNFKALNIEEGVIKNLDFRFGVLVCIASLDYLLGF